MEPIPGTEGGGQGKPLVAGVYVAEKAHLVNIRGVTDIKGVVANNGSVGVGAGCRGYIGCWKSVTPPPAATYYYFSYSG